MEPTKRVNPNSLERTRDMDECLCTLVALNFLGEPSPWPVFRHDQRHTALSTIDTSANAGTLKWKFTTGDGVFSSPALGADGTIYFGSDDHNLYALNPDGTSKWKFTSTNAINSSPALGADGTIYFGSDDNNLYALNPAGTLKWKFTTGDGVVSSPALGADGTIYFGSLDHNLYALV
jgi:outer membrane protein assembly factor BamB